MIITISTGAYFVHGVGGRHPLIFIALFGLVEFSRIAAYLVYLNTNPKVHSTSRSNCWVVMNENYPDSIGSDEINY